MIEQLLPFDGSFTDAAPVFLASLLVKSGIIVGVAGLIAFTLRFSTASLRHMVLTIAMASLLIMPVVLFVLPAWEVPLIPASSNDSVVPTFDSSGEISETSSDYFYLTDNTTHQSTSNTTIVWTPNDNFSVTLGPDALGFSQLPISEDISAATAAPVVRGPSSFTNLNAGSEPAAIPWHTLLAMLWIGGMTVLLARLFLAHAGVNLLLRRSTIVEDSDWRLATDQYRKLLGVERPVRLRVSPLASVPMIIGCRRPMLVLPEGFKNWSSERRRIVLLHELSHVKRFDCLTQYLIEIVCSVYWFNPMVWLASKQIRIEREIACDDMVLMAGTKASTYAQAILDTIRTIRQEEWSPVASIAMARKSDIEGRLISILDPDVRRKRLNRATALLTAGMIAVIAIPIALAVPVEMTTPLLDDTVVEEPLEDERESSPTAAFESIAAYGTSGNSMHLTTNGSTYSIEFDAKSAENANTEWVVSGKADWDTEPNWAPEADCCKGQNSYTLSRNSHKNSFTSESDTLTIRQMIRLRQMGVDAEFIDDIRALGFSSISAEELVELAKYGADPEYISELRSAGYENLDVSEIVLFSKYDVDADLIASLKSYGFSSIKADDLIRLSKYGIDGHDIDDYAKAGYVGLKVDELVELSKFGVDPEEIAEFQAAGFTNLSTEDYIKLSKYGVDADDASGFKTAGYGNLSVDELINISKYGIDADDIAEFGRLGYSNLSLQEMINVGKHDVDVDDVANLRLLGYVDLSIDELVNLGKYGVDIDDIAELNRLGYVNLSVDELINLSKYDVDVDDISTLATLGYSKLSVDDLVRLSKYDTDVDELATLISMGYDKLSIDEMIEFGKYDVDVDDIQELVSAGYTFSVDELVQLSKYDVDGDDVAALAAIGYSGLSLEEIVDLARYDVDADDIAILQVSGFDHLSVNDIINLSKYDVDSELAAELSKMGFDNVSVDQLIKMAKYGIDGDYISELRQTGVDVSIEDIIQLGKHNVSPDYVRSMRSNNN